MLRLKTSFRYAFSKTRGQRSTSLMILLGIAVSLAALLVISAIMNGLQTTQLDQLRNLESFDMIVKSEKLNSEDLKAINGIEEAFNYIETNVLIVDKTSGKSTSSRMRSYEKNVFENSRMNESLSMLTEYRDTEDGLVLSYNMLANLSLGSKDDIKVTFLKKGKTATVVPYTKTMSIDSFYTSRLGEFSSNTVFMNYKTLSSILDIDKTAIAIYANGKLKQISDEIHRLDKNAQIITWQEYNKALYSALMLEKTLMYVFIAFIFMILCVNLKNSTQRLLFNKKKEGAMLRALGCSKKYVRQIFMLQGMTVSLIGEILGIILGKIIIHNIQNILSFASMIITSITKRATVFALIPLNAQINNIEIILICLFIFLLSTLFTYFGCRKIYKSEIMEVILHESY